MTDPDLVIAIEQIERHLMVSMFLGWGLAAIIVSALWVTCREICNAIKRLEK